MMSHGSQYKKLEYGQRERRSTGRAATSAARNQTKSLVSQGSNRTGGKWYTLSTSRTF